MDFVPTPSGLLLPQLQLPSTRPLPRDPRVDLARQTLGFREAFGGPSDMKSLVVRLNTFSTVQLVHAIAWLSAALNTYDGRSTSAEAQRQLSDFFFGDANPLRVRPELADRIVFYELSALNVLKIALLLDGGPSGNDDLRGLGEALLIMNDLADSTMDLLAKDDPLFVETVELYIFANMSCNSDRPVRNEIGRSYDLFLTAHPEVEGYVDIPARIRHAYGISIDDALVALHGLRALFFTLDVDAINRGEFVVHTSRILRDSLDISDEEQTHMLGLVSKSLDEHRALARAQYSLDSFLPFNLRHFERFPLFSSNDTTCCVSMRFLESIATMGLRRLATDSAHFTPSEIAEFHRFKGHVFEDYVHRSLLRAFGPARVVTSAELRRLSGKAPQCDFVVINQRSAFLIECKAADPLLIARSNQSWEGYKTFLETVFVKSAQQIHTTLNNAADGRYLSLGISPESVERYYPMSISMDVSITPLTYQRIDDLCKAAGYLQHDKCSRATFMDSRDLETMETAAQAGQDVGELFLRKTHDYATASISLEQFSRYASYSWTRLPHAHTARLSDELHARVRDHMRKKRRQQPPAARPGSD